MKKVSDRQAGQRVGLPLFFLLELENIYRNTPGAHRALAFPDFLGYLIGLGFESYQKQNAPQLQSTPEAETEPDRERISADLDAWDDFPETNTLRIPCRRHSA